jgi:hypothetical protein
MAIVVKHGGNPAPALVGAYGAGIGKRQAEDARQQAQLAAAEEAQRKSLEAQQREAALNREFTLGRDEAGQERSLETMRLSADLREGSADADQLRRREDVEYAYNARQRQEFDANARAYDEAVNSGEFSDDELKEVKRQVLAKQAGIKPLPKLKKESPYPDGQDVGQVWQAPDSPGVTLTRDNDGNVKKLYESGGGAPSVADVAKIAQTVTESLTTEDAKGGKKSPTPEEIEAGVKRILEMHKRLTGGATTAADGAGAEPPIPEDENPFATVDTATKDAGQVETKMLKNGQKVRVRKLTNGKWEQVN